jgi:hypothetical protein
MSTLFEAPALRLSHKYLIVLLLRLRRFINRSVAKMLASHERQAMRLVLRTLGDRELKEVGLRRTHVRTVPASSAT